MTKLLSLIIVAIVVNNYPDTIIWNLWDDGFRLSDLAIVKKNYFNIIFGVYAASEIFSRILYFFQIKPILEEDAAKKEESNQEIEKDESV